MFRASLYPSSGVQKWTNRPLMMYKTGCVVLDMQRRGRFVCTCWLDADKLRFIDVISSTCFGHHYAPHQEYRIEPTDRLWCTTLVVLYSTCRKEAGSFALVGCEEMTQPVLYIISGLLVHFCTPDDGRNDARNMLS
jgi:hypothetical protein